MTMTASVHEELLSYMRSGGAIESRLRETGDGDFEFLQWGIWGVPDHIDVTERGLIQHLRELEELGRVEARYFAHPYAADEFIVRWKLT